MRDNNRKEAGKKKKNHQRRDQQRLQQPEVFGDKLEILLCHLLLSVPPLSAPLRLCILRFQTLIVGTTQDEGHSKRQPPRTTGSPSASSQGRCDRTPPQLEDHIQPGSIPRRSSPDFIQALVCWVQGLEGSARRLSG